MRRQQVTCHVGAPKLAASSAWTQIALKPRRCPAAIESSPSFSVRIEESWPIGRNDRILLKGTRMLRDHRVKINALTCALSHSSPDVKASY